MPAERILRGGWWHHSRLAQAQQMSAPQPRLRVEPPRAIGRHVGTTAGRSPDPANVGFTAAGVTNDEDEASESRCRGGGGWAEKFDVLLFLDLDTRNRTYIVHLPGVDVCAECPAGWATQCMHDIAAVLVARPSRAYGQRVCLT